MKITSSQELKKPSEVAPRSPESSVTPKVAKVEAAEVPPVDTNLSSMTKFAGAYGEAEHAARLMSVAMALQSGRYSLDIMRIASALSQQ